MRTTPLLRWLTVAVSAVLLLAVAAACGGTKTIEIPGQTIVKEVVKTVEVPGQTVVVKKEVIREVEVPGETVVVTQEVIKLIEAPAAPVEPSTMAANQIEDSKTGKMINPPQYGGSLSIALPFNPGFFDP